MHRALFRGGLRHRRFAPHAHAFRYPLFMVYLDLAELDVVFRGRWLWSTQQWALARFDRADHLGDPAVRLDEAVRDLVQQETGTRPAGPIRLLTHLRYFGHCFNPVSFYYCFDAADKTVECVVAEVNNTPWGERHCYVLNRPDGEAHSARPQRHPRYQRYHRYQSAKVFHVSPFMPMNLDYTWGFSQPGETLNVHMALAQHATSPADERPQKIFDATLRLGRTPITGARLAGVLLRFPMMTAQVVAAIHWQALRLWLKRVPVHTHPAKLKSTAPKI